MLDQNVGKEVKIDSEQDILIGRKWIKLEQMLGKGQNTNVQ